jgi:Ferritin-like domain
MTYHADRRSFLKAGAAASAAVAAGVTFAEEARAHGITKGDIAILKFLSAVEQVESDLWQQYAELGGFQDSEIPGLPTGGNTPYTKALNTLDADMSQYIHDNTEDEFSHHDFLNAYLQFVGAQQVDLSQFATLKGSQATGANKNKLRLTNLMQLTVDTSWWTRYRSRTENPDLNPNFVFPQAVPDLFNNGPFPAIPRTDADATLDSSGNPSKHTQAIANTAAFHFGFIEQGGTSLYPTLALRVTNPVVLRILLSIGPSETMHFQTWHDKAGNAVSDPLAPLTDPTTKKRLMFPNLNSPPFPTGFGLEDFQTNLIMPEPCPFLTDLKPPKPFPAVSIIRPVSTNPKIFGAVQAVNGFIADGLFIGHKSTDGFVNLLLELAEEADEAQRQC